MEIYSQNENYTLYKGNMLDMTSTISENSIDSIVTDPPYELNFMGKGWDNSGIAFQKETWRKCYNALKPGGHLLAFGGSRTFHRIACAIEDAGFEIRDTIMWLYGSGFPKSMALDKALEGKLTTGSGNKTQFRKLNGELVDRGNYGYATVAEQQGARPNDYNNIEDKRLDKLEPTTELAKKYSGWGTALKPSFEPIIVARKPFKGSLVDNVIEYGVGGINIDECRVGQPYKYHIKEKGFGDNFMDDNWQPSGEEYDKEVSGRFPANTILTYDESDFEEVCGGFPNNKGFYRPNCINNSYNQSSNIKLGGGNVSSQYNDSGSAARYFYCAKASKKDRDEGLDNFEEKPSQLNSGGIGRKCSVEKRLDYNGENAPTMKNIHPTVKPTELMQYLIRLVTPNGGTILDPFNGSGSTGKAAMYENRENHKDYKYIGIELTEEYLPISKARIEYVCNLEPEKDMQMTIFDFIGENNETNE